MKTPEFLRFNVFTALLVIASFAFAFRLVDLATFESKTVKSASALEDAAGEEPPPLTKEEVEKAVKETAQAVNEGAPASAESKPKDPAAPQENRAFSAAEIEVLQALSRRRDELERREKTLAEREALLTAAGQEVDRKIAELNKLKEEIEKLLGQQQSMEEGRILSLVKIYEAMKPKEAATIFNTLDMDVLISVVSRMNERKTSPILASMDPEKARLVTIRLAEMRQLPGKTDTAESKEAGAPQAR
jgi:flagellar motility protein MotE (MotC chaperone)